MSQRQFTTPLVIRGLKDPSSSGGATYLQRIPFEGDKADDSHIFSESWLQQLLFKHPALLPISEIEPVFDSPIPIVRELPVGSGALDLLYINSKGFLTLVETKLWRNPEARRAVMAQIIEYANVMAHWSYEDLLKALRKAGLNSAKNPLIRLIKDRDEDFEEKIFIDQVSENLRRGRFLLLVVGDGIQEGLEHMVEFLQQTPRLAFNLSLVEIALFREHPGSNDPIFVQPRIVARTHEVTRAIIEIRGSSGAPEMVVSTPPEEPEGGRKILTEEAFFKELEREKTAGAEVAKFARWVLDNAAAHQLKIHWMKAGPVLKYVDESTDTFFNFGQLSYRGNLAETYRLLGRFKELGLPLEICRDYLDEVARLIPGTSRREVYLGSVMESEAILLGKEGSPEAYVPLAKLAPVKEQWFEAIDKAIRRIREELAKR
jgi:hypothetical protein